jgi:hypothetical protein
MMLRAVLATARSAAAKQARANSGCRKGDQRPSGREILPFKNSELATEGKRPASALRLSQEIDFNQNELRHIET